MFNTLLQVQLKNFFGELDKIPGTYETLFKTISDSYNQHENEKMALTRSMELRSAEMIELSSKLKGETLEATRAFNDLNKINKELDQFAYVVSHDLKAPLRAINNLSGWIEDDLGENATADIKKNMSILRGRVARMESLISGILEYSRVGRQANKLEELDSHQLVLEIIEFLSPPKTFTLTVNKNMPLIYADRVKFQQVVSNLISNAVKHHHTKNGTIKIDYKVVDEYFHFYVTDDGPGIDKQYHQTVFDIFQTLQARDIVESTGIGLSIVKKIIEDAGGTIWLDSEPGKGASFIFSWPINPQKTQVVQMETPYTIDMLHKTSINS